MAKMKGLGRGLESLLGRDEPSTPAPAPDRQTELKVEQLQSGKYQPRSFMDDTALNELASSIKAQGIMQPILVRPVPGGKFEIIAGERRWRAAKLAGLASVPVLVREVADNAALAMALIENIQRENLNPLEEAQGIKRLIDEFAMTHEKAALAVGRSRVAVSNLLRLLSLCLPVQDMLMHGKIDMGHARTLIGLDAAQQVMLAEQIVHNNFSVRDAEILVKKNNEQASPVHYENSHKTKLNHDVLSLQEALSDKLGATVNIKSGANGAGTLKINYANLDQLDEIISKIMR